MSVVLAFLLFFVFVAVLYWNWLRVKEPSAIVTIPTGNEALNGAQVLVEGMNLPQPLEMTLSEDNDYGGRIYLLPGEYRILVKRGQEVLMDREFGIDNWRELTVHLHEPKTTPAAPHTAHP